MKIENIKECYIDAKTEFLYENDSFIDNFVDYNKTYEKLTALNKPHFILSGRKGSGKTAYANYIKSKNNNTTIIDISDLKHDFLVAFKELDSSDSHKILDIWKIIIYFEFFKTNFPSSKVLQKLFSIVDLSKDSNGFDNFKTISTKAFEFKVGSVIKYKPTNSVEKTFSGKNSFFDLVTEIEKEILILMKNKQQYICIDGIDDILKFSDVINQALTGLIISTDKVNCLLLSKKIKSKVILFLRDDILNMINDSDLGKILADKKIDINLSDTETSHLKNIFVSRVDKSKRFNECWSGFFPAYLDIPYKNSNNVIETKRVKSFQYFIDRTLLRPRDIIYFIQILKIDYGNLDNINEEQLITLIDKFCYTYMIDEMKNELKNVLSDEIVDNLFGIFQSTITTSYKDFKYEWFEQKYSKILPEQTNTPEEVLKILFERSYVGNRYYKSAQKIWEYQFRNTHSRSTLQLNSQLVLHNGISTGIFNTSDIENNC